MRLVVGITGASGVIYGISLLSALKESKVETHLIISPQAYKMIPAETGYTVNEVSAFASCVYSAQDFNAPVASGSFLHQGMVIAPCSMKTLAGIACGYADNLIQRAADVTLKEKRKLVLVPRETPLNAIHLENMLKLARLGVVIAPPIPAFYYNPLTVEDIIYSSIGRILDVFSIENKLVPRWGGDPREDVLL